MVKLKAKKVSEIDVFIINKDEKINAPIYLYLSEGEDRDDYVILLPHVVAHLLSVGDAAKLKHIFNGLLDKIIEVENNISDRYMGGLDDIEDSAAEG